MIGVLEGFFTISVIAFAGWLLAHLKVLDMSAQKMLATLTFYIASPALLFSLLYDSDPAAIFGPSIFATIGAIIVAAGTAIAISRWRRHDLGQTVITALCSSYVNGGNVGIPIAIYVLGDTSAVVTTLMIQILVIQPFALTLLDVAVAKKKLTPWEVIQRPLTNPMTVGSAIGLVATLIPWKLPEVVVEPIDIIAGMSVPGLLIAYGISLRLLPLPGRSLPIGDLVPPILIKLFLQPAAAYLIGRYLLGLDDTALLTVTIFAALPTAQNVFIIATRYDRSMVLSRDVVFVTMFASLPVIFVIAGLLS